MHTAALAIDARNWQWMKLVAWEHAVPIDQVVTEKYEILHVSTPGGPGLVGSTAYAQVCRIFRAPLRPWQRVAFAGMPSRSCPWHWRLPRSCSSHAGACGSREPNGSGGRMACS
ncbi:MULTISPECIES: hypothetical protein [unclassified Variovorax]|uniref:hypothetical protein n=1 Tax=unclassified Variovorax TaxID=663243 RepID=UPI003F50DE34